MQEAISQSTVKQDGKYLTFRLMEELFGINVNAILQIIAIPTITPIPKTPTFVKGVINLRGKIIPVIDLRLRFSLAQADYDERTAIIIIKTTMNNSDIFIGIIVDTVLEVMDITADQIEDRPAFGVKLDTEYILGMAKVKGKVVTLLDIENVLSKEELVSMQQIQDK